MWQPVSAAPYDRGLELAVIDVAGAVTSRCIEVYPTHRRGRFGDNSDFIFDQSMPGSLIFINR
jgi:hypothetical protein